MERVLVLNADMTLFGTTTRKRAVKLVKKERAEVIKETNVRAHRTMFYPAVIRLINAVRHLWKKSVPWTKANVHTRDGYKCQYCGTKLERRDLTIDHVVPKDQGGKNYWENTVCACFPCNNKKKNRTPSQANMVLRKQPHQPTIMEFILKKVELDGLNELLDDIFKD